MIANLPVFESREEAEEALANRDKTTAGRTAEEIAEKRVESYQANTEEILDAIS